MNSAGHCELAWLGIALLLLGGTAFAQQSGKIENEVSPKKASAFGSFIKVNPKWDALELDTKPAEGIELSETPSTVGNARDLRLNWTIGEHTKAQHSWHAGTPFGFRVWVTAEGKFFGRGGIGPGGGQEVTWDSNSVDLDLDCDADQDGRIADPKLQPQAEVREDQLEENPGAKVKPNGKAPLLLRRVMPPGRPKGAVTIVRGSNSVDVQTADGKSIFTGDAKTSQDLWEQVKDADLKLTLVGGDTDNGKKECLLQAIYEADTELRFEDTVSITVEPEAKPVSLSLLGSEHMIYSTLEFQIWINRSVYEDDGFPKGLLRTADFTPVDSFDAVDADGNGKKIKVAVMASTEAMTDGKKVWEEFDRIQDKNNAYKGASFWSPAFYARLDRGIDAENWKWYARLFVPKEGKWFFYVLVRSTNAGQTAIFPRKDDTKIKGYAWNLEPDGVPEGRWPRREGTGRDVGMDFSSCAKQAPIAPARPNRRFFCRQPLAKENTAKPFYIFGFCRCWNRWETNEKWKATTWGSAYADVNADIFGPLSTSFPTTGSGSTGTLLSHWFTCWDTNVVHSAGTALKEEWRNAGNAGKGRDLEGVAAIMKKFDGDASEPQPYQYFDQGRARMMDEIMQAAETNRSYVMFTLWPHADIRGPEARTWGMDRWATPPPEHNPNTFSGWSPLQAKFSTFLRNSLGNTKEWNHQLNLYRYIVGRWGNRTGLGLWEGISELDGPQMPKTTLRSWSKRIRSEIRLLGPYNQPFSNSEHNLDGADATGFEYVSTHGYYSMGVRRARNNQELRGRRLGSLWEDDDLVFKSSTVEAEKGYHERTRSLAQPVFNGEFGATQRWMRTKTAPNIPYKIGEPVQLKGDHTTPATGKTVQNYELREKTVSGCHDGLWASFMSGACATPLVWTDGKEFGEMQARSGCKLFNADNYGISFYRELKPLYRLITGAGGTEILPWNYKPEDPARLVATFGYRAAGLKRKGTAGARGVVWIYQTAAPRPPRSIDLSSIARKGSKVQWFDPWAGVKIGVPQVINGPAKVDFWTNGMAHVEPNGYGRRRHQREDVIGIVLADKEMQR